MNQLTQGSEIKPKSLTVRIASILHRIGIGFLGLAAGAFAGLIAAIFLGLINITC